MENNRGKIRKIKLNFYGKTKDNKNTSPNQDSCEENRGDSQETGWTGVGMCF